MDERSSVVGLVHIWYRGLCEYVSHVLCMCITYQISVGFTLSVEIRINGIYSVQCRERETTGPNTNTLACVLISEHFLGFLSW